MSNCPICGSATWNYNPGTRMCPNGHQVTEAGERVPFTPEYVEPDPPVVVEAPVPPPATVVVRGGLGWKAVVAVSVVVSSAAEVVGRLVV